MTVARPQRYCARAIAPQRIFPQAAGSTARRMKKKAPSPLVAACWTSGTASTMAISMAQPNTPETSTLCTISRGALRAAEIVSSAVWAEASKPVIV